MVYWYQSFVLNFIPLGNGVWYFTIEIINLLKYLYTSTVFINL